MENSQILKIFKNSEIAKPENTGAFVVFVLGAGGAVPISGATVKVYDSDKNLSEREPIIILKSGEDGKTEKIYLLENSKIEIEAEHENYYLFKNKNILIYKNITCIQPVYLLPLPMECGEALD